MMAIPLRFLRRVALAMLLSSSAGAQAPTSLAELPPADRIRIAEAFRVIEAMGDSLWPGWTRAPLALLLVTPDREFLVRHPRPSPDFQRVGYDSLLRSDVHRRPRVFPATLLATFPAVGGVPTIVVGQPEHTGKSSSAWVLAIAHEHFHQLQTSRPDYYGRVAALDLAGGDSTGMWMLDYPFPYDSALVQERLAATWRAMSRALASADRAERRRLLAAYVAARDSLCSALSPRDYRYLSFQLWQEGMARFAEHDAARVAAAAEGEASEAFRALPDYRPYGDTEVALRDVNLRHAREPRLAADRRVAFYALGYRTAALLELVAPGWRARYLDAPLSLDVLVP